MSGDELIITAANRQVNWNGKPIGSVGESEYLLIEKQSGQYNITILPKADDRGQE